MAGSCKRIDGAISNFKTLIGGGRHYCKSAFSIKVIPKFLPFHIQRKRTAWNGVV